MTPQVPPLSPEWPATTDQLAQVAHGLHWALEQLAYDLWHRPRITHDGRLTVIAEDLTAFAGLLHAHDTQRQA